MRGWSTFPALWGGGIFGNSGCYGCGIENVLKSIDFLSTDGNISQLAVDDLEFTFRSSALKRGELQGIILRAYFDISCRDNIGNLQTAARSYEEDRKETQDPPANNLGTTVNHSQRRIEGVRGFLIKLCQKIFRYYTKNKEKTYRFNKWLTCIVYNRMDVLRYISDKRMECFIWKDDKADKAFEGYIELMSQAYKDCSIEIEVKE